MLDRLRHRLRVRFIRAVEQAVDNVMERHHRLALEVAERHHRQQQDVMRNEIERVLAALHAVEVRDRRDLLAAGEREAVSTSARFVREAMSAARTFPHPRATLEHALRLASADGMALEFGVASGTTLETIARARGGQHVYGFDSFDGLPEDWRAGFVRGTFRTDEPPEVPGAQLVIGLFADTLPGFLAEHPGPVAFLHLDADLRSSTTTVLEHVGPRLRPGSVLLFDEYFNYPGWEEHEHRAWTEYVARTNVAFRYEAYTIDNEQVVVILTAPTEPTGTNGR